MITLSDDKTPPVMRKCNAIINMSRRGRNNGECELPGGHSGDHTFEGNWWRNAESGPAPADLKTAVKSDGYKVRHELMTTEFRAAISRVLTFGAEKYAAHNWAKGFDWSRLIGASERHLEAFKGGEDYDPETGEHHLAHLGCEIMFLLEHSLRGMGNDDRLQLPALLPVPPAIQERRAAALAAVKKAKADRTTAEDEALDARRRAARTPTQTHLATEPAVRTPVNQFTCGTPTACSAAGKCVSNSCKLAATPPPAAAPAPAFDLSDVEADGFVTMHPPLPAVEQPLTKGVWQGYLASDIVRAAAAHQNDGRVYSLRGEALWVTFAGHESPSIYGPSELVNAGLRKPEVASPQAIHWCAAKRADGALCERPPGHEGDHRAVGGWWREKPATGQPERSAVAAG